MTDNDSSLIAFGHIMGQQHDKVSCLFSRTRIYAEEEVSSLADVFLIVVKKRGNPFEPMNGFASLQCA